MLWKNRRSGTRMKMIESLDEKQDRFSDFYLKLREKYMARNCHLIAPAHASEKKVQYSKSVNPVLSISEKHLKVIWYEKKFDQYEFKLSDGRKLVVDSFGNWNTGGGPDFKNVQIRIGNEIICGDVEIHLRSSDWVRHGHHLDSNYNRVILHVVLIHNSSDPTVTNQKGDAIPELELQAILSNKIETLLTGFEVEGYPYKSDALLGECAKIIGLPSHIGSEKFNLVQVLLKIAGDGRILLKGKQFNGLTQNMERSKLFGKNNEKKFIEQDEFIYSKIFEGLGYSQNKLSMNELSRRVPCSSLRDAVIGISDETRVLRIQSILFGAAGLLPDSLSELDEETKKTVGPLISEWKKFQTNFVPMKKSQWVFRGCRPNNFPARRLAGISYFLAQNVEKGLFQTCLDVVYEWKKVDTESKEKKYAKCLHQAQQIFCQPVEDYFEFHSDFGRKKFKRKVALIGKERSLAIWVNVFLPLLVRWCRENQDSDLERELYFFWQKIPSLTMNHVVRMMVHRFLGACPPSFVFNKEINQQGLLQIFQDFCDIKPTACTGCNFSQIVSIPLLEFSKMYSSNS